MKQNIIIVLLTAIFCLLGLFAAQFHEDKQLRANAKAVQSVQDVKQQIAKTSQELNRAVVEADLAVQDIKETAGLPMDEVVNGGIYQNKSTEVKDPSDPKPKNQGVIQIVAIVDKDGKVIEANLLNRSQFKELNDAALNNTLNKKIPPKIINGQPFKTRYLIPVKYEVY